MASAARLRKRLLRQAMVENLQLVEGKAPRGRQSGLRLSRRIWATVLVVVPVVLVGVAYVVGQAAAERRGDGGGGAVVGLEAPDGVGQGLPTLPDVVGEGRPDLADPRALGREVLPLAVRRVVLDPGHGGDNHGTAGRNGLMEKELTLDIAERLRILLEAAAYEVVMTRTADVSLSLSERGDIANRLDGDIFVSIHVNWLGGSSQRGVETYYLGTTDDPYVERLAAAENLDGGLRLADYREALDRLYAGVRREESRALAGAIQRSLLAAHRARAADVRNRGVKSAPFGVLMRTEMPAVLAEVGALSSELESELLRDPAYRQFLAEALFSGIEAYSESLN